MSDAPEIDNLEAVTTDAPFHQDLWRPTCALRWEYVSLQDQYTASATKTLQQLWVNDAWNSKERAEWRDVEVVP